MFTSQKFCWTELFAEPKVCWQSGASDRTLKVSLHWMFCWNEIMNHFSFIWHYAKSLVGVNILLKSNFKKFSWFDRKTAQKIAPSTSCNILLTMEVKVFTSSTWTICLRLDSWASIDNILFFVGFAFVAWTCLCLRITVMILVLVASIVRIVVYYCFAVWLSWFFYTRHSRFLISHSPIPFRFRILADFRFQMIDAFKL